MANFDTLKNSIDENINTNGKQEITGWKLNSVLNQMVSGMEDINNEVAKLSIDVDAELSTTSTNPVQNKVVSEALNDKQNTIADLETIRSGAAKGATALQSVPSTYATKTDVDNAIANAITTTLNTPV